MDTFFILLGTFACMFFGIWMWVAAVASANESDKVAMSLFYSLLGTVLIMISLLSIVVAVVKQVG